MKNKEKLLKGTILSVALVALAGCASTMVSQHTQDHDDALTSVIHESFEANAEVQAGKIDIETREGIVSLTGVVETEKARSEAGRIAWRTEGVKGVHNDITVGERTVGSWADDVLISSKVKSKLLANSGIKAGDIDVSSSQSVVTLIGRVSTSAIRTEAGQIARDTKGVKSVNNELLVGAIRK